MRCCRCLPPVDLSLNYFSNIVFRTIPVQARAARAQPQPSLGFFLQCQGKNSDSDPEWTCTARAELKIKSHKRNIADFWRRIEHKFHPQENDWGFRQMMTLEVCYLLWLHFFNIGQITSYFFNNAVK